MKRSIIIFLLSQVNFASYCQSVNTDQKFTSENIGSKIFTYVPIQREGVTDQRFLYAKRILDDTRSARKNDPANLNVADYWNITTLFVVLKEPKANVEVAFNKAITLDPKTICNYINVLGPSKLDKIIPEEFLSFYAKCVQSPSDENKGLDVVSYSATNKLDPKLVMVINTVSIDDQKFRMSAIIDWARQKPVDSRNQYLIDSLFAIYKTYIGRYLVGKPLENTMWAVIQHSSVEMMERYLPVLSAAVQQKQLEEIPLKMLIDRFYWLKYNYQIFGSQGASVKLADEKTKQEVVAKYNLN